MPAVIKIGSSQYVVEPGSEILASRAKIDSVIFPPKTKIAVKDLGQVKGQKVRVSKYKAKSRYRKVRGFRPIYHRLRIGQIGVDTREKKS